MTERESGRRCAWRAMIPARRAVCSGSPFFTAAGADRPQGGGGHRDSPAGNRLSRGDRLSLTSTIRTCAAARRRATGARPTSGCLTPTAHSACLSSAARKNDRLSSDTVRSTLFSFTSAGTFSVPGEKLRIALMPARHDGVDDGLRSSSRDGNHRDRDPLAPHDAPEVAGIGDRHPAARLLADLCPRIVSNSAAISNPSARNPG